jgi:mono/diheme cytochrome c family protein
MWAWDGKMRDIGSLACKIVAAGVVAAIVSAASPPPATGIYSEAQSERGAAVYAQHCAACHGAELTAGSAPPLTGPFWSSWNGRSMAELYGIVQGSMPQDAPSSLSDTDYADVVAHMLKVGGYPSGAADLPASREALATLKIGPAE